MSSAQIVADYESAPVTADALPGVTDGDKKEKTALGTAVTVTETNVEEDGARIPTELELATLRFVPAAMPWAAIGMCLIEFAERASYYGSTGVFANFIRNPLPVGGNGAGAVAKGALGLNESAGALGMGTQTSSAITVLFTFLAYTIPILGGIIADTKWGRFKTICVGTAIGATAHVLLVIPAIPAVLEKQNASLGVFILAIRILAFASGFIKPCLSPLLCDQSPVKRQTVITLKSGEDVILDPKTTVQRYMLVFYWLAYHHRLYKAPPQGSVVLEASAVVKRLFMHGGWKRCWKGGDAFWDAAKPTNIEAAEGSIDRTKIPWDDQFVNELRQSFSACKVFLLIPIFSLSDGGLGNSESAMSVAMVSNGVPNDLISNFNSLTIVFAAPIINFLIYPWLRKRGVNIKATWLMCIGFCLGGINMIVGAILQWQVYKTSPCGYQATTNCAGVSTISLWTQIPLYSLPAIGEILVNVTSYEIAYTRAPARMKGLVYAMVLFVQALAAALAEICNPSLQDPYLIWPYVALAVACFLCAAALPIFFSGINEPVVFGDIDRMEGRQQPLFLENHGASSTEENEKKESMA